MNIHEREVKKTSGSFFQPYFLFQFLQDRMKFPARRTLIVTIELDGHDIFRAIVPRRRT